MSALDPVILSQVSTVAAGVADLQSRPQGATPVGAMALLPSEAPVVTIGEQVYLRAGVAAPRASYPGFPTDVPQSAVGAVWDEVALPKAHITAGIVHGNGVFVAVSSNQGVSLVSAGGKAWTEHSMPGAFSGIAFGNGVFVAVRVGSSSSIATSPDGKTWTARSLPESLDASGIAFGNGTFVIAAKGATKAATSPDGVTWTSRVTPSAASSLVFGNGVFIGTGPRNWMRSADGVTWTGGSISSHTTSWTGSVVAFGNGVFMVASTSTPDVAVSQDGASWVAATGLGANAVRIGFAAGRFYLSTAAMTGSSYRGDVWMRNPMDIPKATNAVLSAVADDGGVVVAGFNAAAAYMYRSGDVIGAAEYKQYHYVRVK
ncbi:hypothetical protein ACKC5O_00400 [Aeromonas schubertii]|uniref:hypothetical protein n=1 Tax=Aeromonas schubertii TaxID=652 RepID=UPI0038B4E49A